MLMGSAEHRGSSTKLNVGDCSVWSRSTLRRTAAALLLAGACSGFQSSGLATAAGRVTSPHAVVGRSGVRGGAAETAPVAQQGAASSVRSTGLDAVVATSSRDAWAVGNETIDHWNGSKWQSVAGASVPPGVSWHLDAVTAIPATNPVELLAVGATSSHALIERWDGTQWERLTPAGNADKGVISTASALSPSVMPGQ